MLMRNDRKVIVNINPWRIHGKDVIPVVTQAARNPYLLVTIVQILYR